MNTQEQTAPRKRVKLLGNGIIANEEARIFQAAGRWEEAGRTGTMVSGTLLSVTTSGQYNSKSYTFEADSAGEYIDGDGAVQAFNKGDKVVVNGCAGLDKKMSYIPLNTSMEVIYTGAVILTNGKRKGKPAFNFEILVDEGSELVADEDTAS